MVELLLSNSSISSFIYFILFFDTTIPSLGNTKRRLYITGPSIGILCSIYWIVIIELCEFPFFLSIDTIALSPAMKKNHGHLNKKPKVYLNFKCSVIHTVLNQNCSHLNFEIRIVASWVFQNSNVLNNFKKVLKIFLNVPKSSKEFEIVLKSSKKF